MSESETGTLIAIGGHEDREGDRLILRAVADAMCDGPLLIVASASRRPEKYVAMYRTAFHGIGVDDVREFTDPRDLETAGGVFLTGGSQARLVEPILGTAQHEALRHLLDRCGVIAGTSAGATALGQEMLSGTAHPRLAPGLDLVPGVMFDQHFSQRDRLGRLTAGLRRVRLHTAFGIDEDTAVVLRGDDARVIGAGTVTVLRDGRPATVLRSGDAFRLGDTIAA